MNDLYRDAAVSSTFSFDNEVLKKALKNIYSKDFNPMDDIEENLFNEVCNVINNATDKGFRQSSFHDPDDDFRNAIKNNNEVFSAFKVHRMQVDMSARLLDSNGNLKPFEQWAKDVQPIADHQVRSWLQTEYDTAIIRAHQAADWKQFEREKDILPNLKWMPSTSIHPGADHQVFWGTIRPIDDAFWNMHRPGDRWNCKCSLSATDEPVTKLPFGIQENGNPQNGLESNPGKDGALFSDKHPYFPNDCAHCSFYDPNVKDIFSGFFNAKRKKECYSCKYIRKCINDTDKKDKEHIAAKRQEYRELLANANYKDVAFDKKTGGVKATHVGHVDHDGPKAERFFGGLSSSDLERECQYQVFSTGHSAILRDESKKKNGNRLAALDLELDHVVMDIRSVTGKGWYSNIFVKKNHQLIKYNERDDVEEQADSLCLYFHEPKLFDLKKMKKSINYFRYYRGNDGSPMRMELKHVYCVIKGQKNILMFDI